MKLNTNNKSFNLQVSGCKSDKARGHKLKTCALVSCLLVSFLFPLPAMAAKQKASVYVKKFKNSRYELIVSGKPYIIKGVCYNPIPIGQNHEYDWWSDPNKPWIADGKLMKEMGINTIRLYQSHENIEEVRAVIRDFYELYGIRTIMGSWLGFWQYPCPFYADKIFQDKVKREAVDMVNQLKDEPGVLLWILGNENNYSCLGRVNPWTSEDIDKEPDPQKKNLLRAKIYYSFVNDIAKEIHQIDTKHPVAIGNGELVGLESANLYCPDIDIVGCIIYRGRTFGNLFKSLKSVFDRPVFFAEFGADCYDAYLKKEDQNMQAFFLESQWRQIYENLNSNKKEGEGNCIGGTMFEWIDEWWKHDESSSDSWKVQDTESNWNNGNYYFDIKAEGNKNMNEEWFGIVALSTEMENGLNKRIPRKAYYVIREFWKKPNIDIKKAKKK
ncbi:MAG: hypothetical protein PHO70_07060 [Candidatus Omnitrophica bacterium]|nr:hypothetical protein [Candidatus Omnitrophota bacterium]